MRLLLASTTFTAVLITFSYVINQVVLGEAHTYYDFFRPDNDFRVMPGLLITSFIWSIFIGIAYLKFNDNFKGQHPFFKGGKFGLSVFLFFILFQELFYYQFIKFEFIIIFGSILHYLLTFLVGGGLIGVILEKKKVKSS